MIASRLTTKLRNLAGGDNRKFSVEFKNLVTGEQFGHVEFATRAAAESCATDTLVALREPADVSEQCAAASVGGWESTRAEGFAVLIIEQ